MSIRVDEELKQRAEIAAGRSRRSVGKQIEYWAAIGEVVSRCLSDDEVHRLLLGESQIKVVNSSLPLSIDSLVSEIDSRRSRGQLSALEFGSGPYVEADPEKPGSIRFVDGQGEVVVKSLEAFRQTNAGVQEQKPMPSTTKLAPRTSSKERGAREASKRRNDH